MSLLTPEMQAQISVWRQKAAEGTLTVEEQREAIKILREGRLQAMTAAKASKAKSATGESKPRAKKVARSADDLLGELGGLKSGNLF